MLTDFHNSFIFELCTKFAISWLLKIPPHLKHVATLPCETFAFKIDLISKCSDWLETYLFGAVLSCTFQITWFVHYIYAVNVLTNLRHRHRGYIHNVRVPAWIHLHHWSYNGIVTNAVFHCSSHINQTLPRSPPALLSNRLIAEVTYAPNVANWIEIIAVQRQQIWHDECVVACFIRLLRMASLETLQSRYQDRGVWLPLQRTVSISGVCWPSWPMSPPSSQPHCLHCACTSAFDRYVNFVAA